MLLYLDSLRDFVTEGLHRMDRGDDDQEAAERGGRQVWTVPKSITPMWREQGTVPRLREFCSCTHSARGELYAMVNKFYVFVF